MTAKKSFENHRVFGLAVDPVHVGTGGARLGRVDNTIVRDPVTRAPKIPGSSLAGVYRSYVAMQAGKYPRCAGQGDHCGEPDCPVCMCFGFANNDRGGFAGLAGFSDAHVVLFPVPTRKGPRWIASPSSLGEPGLDGIEDGKAYTGDAGNNGSLNLGWLLLPEAKLPQSAQDVINELTSVPQHVRKHAVVVTDKLFGHIVNSNLEVRTSVSIDPATGAAEDGALFTYEAIPRGTVLAWDITCRNPAHFTVGKKKVAAVSDMRGVYQEVAKAHELLEHLGIGGMGTRGMGRLRVLENGPDENKQPQQTDGSTEGAA